MLAGIEPWRLTIWEAMYRLEPWGDDWVQNARLEAAIINTQSTDKIEVRELIPNEDNRPADDADVSEAAVWRASLGF